MGGGGGGGVVGVGQGGCEQRIEVFVKIQKKKNWGVGVGLGGQGGCERRIEVFCENKKNKKNGGGGGAGVRYLKIDKKKSKKKNKLELMFMKHYAPNRCLYIKVAKLRTGVGSAEMSHLQNRCLKISG